MRVTLNGEPCEVPPGLASFGDLVFFVEQQRLPAGEVLTVVSLNGEELDEAEEADAGGRPCSSIERADFLSARPIDLARGGLTDAAELLPSLASDLPEVAAALRSSRLAEGLEMFSPCLEVLSWYVSLLRAVDTLLGREDGLTGLGAAASQGDPADELAPELDGAASGAGLEHDELSVLRSFASIENLRQKLVDIELAQEQSDHLLLADLIEYELLPIVEIWVSESALLLRRVNLGIAVA